MRLSLVREGSEALPWTGDLSGGQGIAGELRRLTGTDTPGDSSRPGEWEGPGSVGRADRSSSDGEELLLDDGKSKTSPSNSSYCCLFGCVHGERVRVTAGGYGEMNTASLSSDEMAFFLLRQQRMHTTTREYKQERENDVLQDKIYGFYNEKNKDTDMYSDMWKSFVTQICVTDNGGPKNNLQSTWTSQLNARLFCGDKDQKQHFSELVDIATVEADHWQDTRVYGLFRNEWGMSAVCVYTIQDINHVFKTSPFKNSEMQPDRSRTVQTNEEQIEANSEMKNYIEPQNSSGPLLISRHHYTRITTHRLQNHTILIFQVNFSFLPFNHRAFIVNLDLHPSTRTLYIASRTELAQMDVANCQGYGNSCEECIMARDPYCGWTQGMFKIKSNSFLFNSGSPQDTEHLLCPNMHPYILIPLGSRYFFECPVSSLHANYTWYHNSSPTVSCSGDEHQCFMLIHSVKPEQLGTYTCVSMEQGYRQVLAQYQLEVDDCANGFTPGALLWVSLIAAFLVQS
uniref:Sema domain-containing protein n=1 Tax=Periophthalmus magnuspinnatus TaxID=409849 RepID=A0A3B3Z8Q8_9GOBI